MRFPSIKAVAKELRAHNDYLRKTFRVDLATEEFCGDVRLQVFNDGSWTTHCGDAQYDLNHHGYWGSSCLDGKRFNSHEVAKDLILQAREQYAQEKP